MTHQPSPIASLEELRPRLTEIALRLLRDPDDAADAVGEAILGVLRNREGIRGDVAGYAARATVARSYDIAKRRKRGRTVLSVDALDGGPWDFLAQASHDPFAVDSAALRASRLLDALTPPQRAALGLKAEGYRDAEIAAILGVPLHAAKRNLHEGRKRALGSGL